METVAKLVALAIGGIITAILFGLILAFPVMLLWNDALVPAVTGIKTICWTQAWGIMVLFGILVKPSSSN
jgi:hypothetical protein